MQNKMRILHCCLAAFYIDGYNYQENVLPRISKEKGHDVLIIASTETYVGNTSLGYVAPSDYITEYGVPIKRLPYKHIVSHRISRKIRKYIGLYDAIERFAPDIIFSHDISYASVIDVVEYVKNHPNVTFLADTHTAAYNSGLNWMSLNILHRLIYKRYIGKTIPYLKKYYYIGPAERDFSVINYGVPEGVMEFLPLGGIIPDAATYMRQREKFRREFGVAEGELLELHLRRRHAIGTALDDVLLAAPCGLHHLIDRAVAIFGKKPFAEHIGHLVKRYRLLVEIEILPVGLLS